MSVCARSHWDAVIRAGIRSGEHVAVMICPSDMLHDHYPYGGCVLDYSRPNEIAGAKMRDAWRRQAGNGVQPEIYGKP